MSPLPFNTSQAQIATEGIEDLQYRAWAQDLVNNILGPLGNNSHEAIREAVSAFKERLRQRLGYISQDELRKELMWRRRLIERFDNVMTILAFMAVLVAISSPLNLASLAFAVWFGFRCAGIWGKMDGAELDNENPQKRWTRIRLVLAGISIWLTITNNFSVNGLQIIIALAVSLLATTLFCWIIPASLQRAWLKRVNRSQNLYLPFVNEILPQILNAAYDGRYTGI